MSIKQKGAPSWWDNDQWATPMWFVKLLVKEFANATTFDLDPCATVNTSKAEKYYTKDDDGLKKKWRGRVFVNPPFSNPAPWVRKAALQVEKGNAEVVVMLLPASIATNWFHDWVLPYAEVHYIRGRLSFLDWKGRAKGGNRTDCFIAVYKGGGLNEQYSTKTFPSREP